MNCHAESFFQNCSLIAPSRLSECVFIYCSIAPSWFTPLHTFPLSIFPACFLQTYTKHFFVKQGTLTTFTFEEFFLCLPIQAVPAGSLQPSSRSSATGLRAMVGAGVRSQMLQQFRGTAEHLTAKICNVVIDNRCNFIVFLKAKLYFAHI